MKIAIDLDEVLAEFMVGFLKWWNLEHQTNLTFGEVSDYHFENFIGVDKDELTRKLHEFYKTDFYIDASVVDGAREAIEQLVRTNDLYLITARQEVNRGVTLAWIDRYFPNIFKEVALLNHYALDGSPAVSKGEICGKLGCQVIVDDNPHNIQSLLDEGVRVVVFNKPWNSYLRMPPQVIRADDWPEIVEAVNKLTVV